MRSRSRRILLLAAIFAWMAAGVPAGAQIFEAKGFKLTGDVRARLEADVDSQTAEGIARDDRTRLRIRLRLGLEYAPGERFTFGLRLRSGSADSQQSPHVTLVDFDGNDTGDADVGLDRWFLEARSERAWAWIGRNGLPFWKQNEILWDDDVTPAGLAAGRTSAGERGVDVQGGYFLLPVGLRSFAGNLGLAQAIFRTRRLTAAAGLLAIDADPGDPDAARLLRGNGARDYRIWAVGLQLRSGSWTFGADVYHNGESYPVSEPLRDEVDGWVVAVKLDRGGWQLAWTYTHIEALAVHSSYAQDDWVRWGTATQTRASDLRGHELRFVRDLGDGQDVVVRLYLVEALTTVEDGSRFRVDYNYRF